MKKDSTYANKETFPNTFEEQTLQGLSFLCSSQVFFPSFLLFWLGSLSTTVFSSNSSIHLVSPSHRTFLSVFVSRFNLLSYFPPTCIGSFLYASFRQLQLYIATRKDKLNPKFTLSLEKSNTAAKSTLKSIVTVEKLLNFGERFLVVSGSGLKKIR